MIPSTIPVSAPDAGANGVAAASSNSEKKVARFIGVEPKTNNSYVTEEALIASTCQSITFIQSATNGPEQKAARKRKQQTRCGCRIGSGGTTRKQAGLRRDCGASSG